jgi:hypothetical protein
MENLDRITDWLAARAATIGWRAQSEFPAT